MLPVPLLRTGKARDLGSGLARRNHALDSLLKKGVACLLGSVMFPFFIGPTLPLGELTLALRMASSWLPGFSGCWSPYLVG